MRKKIVLALLSIVAVASIFMVNLKQEIVEDSNISDGNSIIKEINNSIDKNISRENLVVSIHGEYITKDELPKEYDDLNYEQKRKFLSKYIYLKVALNGLEDKRVEYKKEIEEAIERERSRLEKIGIELTPLEELIWIENITFQTIAFNEVLKQHKDIDDEVESFYKKREKSFNFPDTVDISHISLKDKSKADSILKELLDKNISTKEFAKYAKKYSQDYKSNLNGGYIGNIGKDGLGDGFFKRLWDSNITSGVYPELLEKKGYYHIIYIIAKIKEHQKTLNDERENIEMFILSKEIKRWKAQQFKKSDKTPT